MSLNCLEISSFERRTGQNILCQQSQKAIKMQNFSFAARMAHKRAEFQKFQHRSPQFGVQTLSKCLSDPQLQKNQQKQFKTDNQQTAKERLRTSHKNINKCSEATTISNISSTFEQHSKDGNSIKIMPLPQIFQQSRIDPCSPTFKHFRGEALPQPPNQNYERQSQISGTSSLRCISQLNLVTSPKFKGVKLKDYIFTTNAARELICQNRRKQTKKRCVTQNQQNLDQSQNQSQNSDLLSSISIIQAKLNSRKLTAKIIKKEIASQLTQMMTNLSAFQNTLKVGNVSQQQVIGMYRKREAVKGWAKKWQKFSGKLIGGCSSRVNIILEEDPEEI